MSLSTTSSVLLNTFRDGDYHFPGQLVPMLDNPFHEEFFPNNPSRPSLAQYKAESMACNLREKTNIQPPVFFNPVNNCLQHVENRNKNYYYLLSSLYSYLNPVYVEQERLYTMGVRKIQSF